MSQKHLAYDNAKLSQKNPDTSSNQDSYSAFDQLNGEHPWRDFVPEGLINYPVRILPRGQIAYFNYSLAKEMGLLPEDHPPELNPELRKKIISTFSLRIINEYDQEQGIQYPKKHMKSHLYMATRYLQLQHPDKCGRTSGDGRCIWNGFVTHQGVMWDVSSRGTGVTALAPGAVEAGRPLQSGATQFGYGCGMADLDELYGAAILAEIFHNQGIETERILTIIDLGNGTGIGVRAGKNLIRPAHMFLYLKQGNLEALRRSVDYFIIRQHRNGEWNFGIHHPRKYQLMLKKIISNFAKFVAQLDRQYIFAWLDWDGDNVLASAGIIDYGSVRQFGIRHDQYRYDDTDRYSTSLNQQIPKARKMMQAFVQIVDYLETGLRQPFASYAQSSSLHDFDQFVERELHFEFLKQLGFSTKDSQALMAKHLSKIKELYLNFSYLERKKTRREARKVADGINRPAVYNLRIVIYQLALFFNDWAEDLTNAKYPIHELFGCMLSEHASSKDSILTHSTERHLIRFQEQYRQIIEITIQASKRSPASVMLEIFQRASIINRKDRITGNALIHIVGELMDARKKGLSFAEAQKVIDEFISSQSLNPHDIHSPIEPNHLRKPMFNRREKKLLSAVFTLIEGHKEDI